MADSSAPRTGPVAWRNDPKIRAFFFQALVLGSFGLFVWFIVDNTITNLERQNIASGFDFLSTTAGFGIVQTLIEYSEQSSYGRAFLVALINTLLVSGLGIFFATIIGFLIGIARLSPNWLLSRLAAVYIETFRNIPLLLQILFWYIAVLSNLPGPRNSLMLLGETGALNSRGLYLPAPVPQDGAGFVLAAFIVAIVTLFGLRYWAHRRQRETGRQFPLFWVGSGLIIGLPLLAILLTGVPYTADIPELRGFNYRGGIRLIPELMALVIALAIYTAAFIAEIVRAGIQSVSWGQSEAAMALGLRPGVTLRLVIIPQAMRVIIPPLTSQYLNLTKNSSLAAAMAYPELTSVFAGTVLNQTGQAIEVLGITMAVYLSISLVTSLAMNWYNARNALVER